MAHPAHDAYNAGFHGYEESDLSHGGRAAYKLGRGDREAGRDYRDHAGSEKAYNKAQAQARRADRKAAAPAAPVASSSRDASPGSGSTGPSTAAQLNRLQRIQSAVPKVTCDASGLLLASVLYGLGLAVVKYGAAGPGLWFRAKWLNQVPSQPGQAAPRLPGTPKGSTTQAPGQYPPGVQINPSQQLPRTPVVSI